MAAEYAVVVCQIVGNPTDGYDISRSFLERLPSLASAKRWGLRRLDHDDFNIAVVDGDRLIDWTWMGDTLSEPPETMFEIAESLGWRFAGGRP